MGHGVPFKKILGRRYKGQRKSPRKKNSEKKSNSIEKRLPEMGEHTWEKEENRRKITKTM